MKVIILLFLTAYLMCAKSEIYNIYSDKWLSEISNYSPEKINKYIPGRNIKILKYKKNILKDYDYVFLGAWNFKKEILNKEKKFLRKGVKFITHIPYPKILY